MAPFPEHEHEREPTERVPASDVGAPRLHAREPASSVAPRRRHDPDEEAIAILLRVVERVEVAKSFARITTGMLLDSASRAGGALRVYADVARAQAGPAESLLRARVEHVRRVARAAREAAAHVAVSEMKRHASDDDETR